MKNCFSCKSTFEKEGCKDINDHSSCVKNYYRYKAAVKLKPEKKNVLSLKKIQIYDLCNMGAVLYQLRNQANWALTF